MGVVILGSYVQAHSLQVEQLPQVGESVTAQALWVEHGGKGLNLALGMHRLGLDVNLILAVGTDNAGQNLIKYLDQQGLSTKNIKAVSGSSGFGVGLVANNGQNTIAIFAGANALLTALHIAETNLNLTSQDLVCAQFEVPEAPIIKAFQLARESGSTTVLNPSPWREPSIELQALTDIWVLNEVEAQAFLKLTFKERLSVKDWEQLLPQLQWSGQLLIVTLAEYGCIAIDQTQTIYYQPALVLEHVLDPTGAGDAFTAGFVYALSQQQSLNSTLQFANLCGAYVTAHQGVLEVLPTLNQLKAFDIKDFKDSTLN